MTNFIINFGNTELLILLAMLPSIVIGFIIYKKDIIEKEPIKLLLKLFLFGILSTGVALFLEIYAEKIFPFSLQSNIIGILFRSFIIISFCEELVKWLFTYVICWKDKNFNYVYDAIVYCVFISLGFASIENLIAILSNSGGFTLALQRGLITVPAHAFFGIISGYYLGLAKKYEARRWNKRKRKYIILSLLIPIIVHGMFDSLLFLSSTASLLFATALIVYLYLSSALKVVKTSSEAKKITRR